MNATHGPALIVCMDAKRGIGKGNTLPWKIPEDMRHFRETTTGHTVIMGGKTFDSIGKALPDRLNIVISRRGVSAFPRNVLVTNSLRGALSLASHDKQRRIFIIGGQMIYEQALHVVDQMIITQLKGDFDCNKFFPEFAHDAWDEYQPAKVVLADAAPQGEIIINYLHRRLPH